METEIGNTLNNDVAHIMIRSVERLSNAKPEHKAQAVRVISEFAKGAHVEQQGFFAAVKALSRLSPDTLRSVSEQMRSGDPILRRYVTAVLAGIR